MNEATTAGANRRYDIIPWAAQNAIGPVIEMERGRRRSMSTTRRASAISTSRRSW